MKTYRKFAQSRIDKASVQLTIDQWLVLQVILENDGLTQREIGERVFKDQASIARIIALLASHGLVMAENQVEDARRMRLRVTEEGHRTLEAVMPIVQRNRRIALKGLSDMEIEQLQSQLERIFQNLVTHKGP